MSVGLYKYDGNIYDDAKEIISESIASQSMYEKYLYQITKIIAVFLDFVIDMLYSVSMEVDTLWNKENTLAN